MMNTPLECCSISDPLEKICIDLETRKTLEDYNKIVILEKLSFSKGDLVVLGSRPGLGKTGLALSLTRKLAIEQNFPIGIISPETNRRYITLRLLSQILEIEYEKLAYKPLPNADIARIKNISKLLSKCPIYINDKRLISINEIKESIIEMNSKYNAKIFFIDNIGLIQEIAVLQQEEDVEITDECILRTGYFLAALKQLAAELNIVIVALSQISRSPTGAVPSISSFKGLSPIIKEKADKVLLLNRYRTREEKETTDFTLAIYENKSRNVHVITGRYFESYIRFDFN